MIGVDSILEDLIARVDVLESHTFGDIHISSREEYAKLVIAKKAEIDQVVSGDSVIEFFDARDVEPSGGQRIFAIFLMASGHVTGYPWNWSSIGLDSNPDIERLIAWAPIESLGIIK